MKRSETLSKLRSKHKKYEHAIPGSCGLSRAPSEVPSRAPSPPPSQAKTRSKVDWISDYRARVKEGTNAEPSGNGRAVDLAHNALTTIEETAELGENPDFVKTLNSMWGTLMDNHIIKQISEEGNLINIPSSADQTAEVWVHDMLTQTAGAINSLSHLLYASLRREKHLMAYAVINQTKTSQILEDIKQQLTNHDERLAISHDTLTKQMYNLTSIVATNHTLYKDNFTCLFSAIVDNSGTIAESMGEKIIFTNPEGNEMDVDKIDLTDLSIPWARTTLNSTPPAVGEARDLTLKAISEMTAVLQTPLNAVGTMCKSIHDQYTTTTGALRALNSKVNTLSEKMDKTTEPVPSSDKGKGVDRPKPTPIQKPKDTPDVQMTEPNPNPPKPRPMSEVMTSILETMAPPPRPPQPPPHRMTPPPRPKSVTINAPISEQESLGTRTQIPTRHMLDTSGVQTTSDSNVPSGQKLGLLKMYP